MITLKNARIFDGVHEELREGAIIIEGDVIQEIVPNETAPVERGEIIDMGGQVVSPGFIDCHLHFFLDEIPDKSRLMNDRGADGVPFSNGDFYLAYKGAAAARTTLMAGFTTVFDGGGVNLIDVALKDAINKNYIEGPNYYICGQQITAEPSHFRGLGEEVIGPWGMRKAVRQRLYWGCDHIKLKMSAPVRTPGRSLTKVSFSVEEVLAATDEAHQAGLQVSAHTRGAQSIIDSINGGVDIIVHGTDIDDTGIELMLKKGLYLLPTLASPPSKAGAHIVAAKSPKVVEQLEATGRRQFESMKKAYRAGVKIALSTDSGGVGVIHGKNAEELLRMKEIRHD